MKIGFGAPVSGVWATPDNLASFAADEVPDVIEAVIDTYRHQRAANERFIDTVKRVGLDPFKTAASSRLTRGSSVVARDSRTSRGDAPTSNPSIRTASRSPPTRESGISRRSARACSISAQHRIRS